MKYSIAISLGASIAAASAHPKLHAGSSLHARNISRRADFPIPSSAGSETFSEPYYVEGSYDGGLKTFGRGVSCTSGEGGESDAVFVVPDGGSLSNVIIGADQIEGVYCQGSCTITNVWWEAVCEDALSLKGNGDVYVSGGGATGASDKVIQHNGSGTVTIDGFTVVDFGKLYRSCGNCDTMGERHVVVKNVVADSGSVLTGINTNYGDTSTITDTCATSVDAICTEYQGNDTGDQPTEISSGPSSACIYTEPLSAC